MIDVFLGTVLALLVWSVIDYVYNGWRE